MKVSRILLLLILSFIVYACNAAPDDSEEEGPVVSDSEQEEISDISEMELLGKLSIPLHGLNYLSLNGRFVIVGGDSAWEVTASGLSERAVPEMPTQLLSESDGGKVIDLADDPQNMFWLIDDINDKAYISYVEKKNILLVVDLSNSLEGKLTYHEVPLSSDIVVSKLFACTLAMEYIYGARMAKFLTFQSSVKSTRLRVPS